MIRERAREGQPGAPGRRRAAPGLHELCSLFASLELADELTIEPLGGGSADEVVCPGVDGPNLAARALDALRAALDGDLPPLRVTIDKRIPVAAGLGGGSADAAAVLRAANGIAGTPLDAGELRAIGARIGADVPSQIEPRHALVTGAGEHVEPLDLPPMALVLVPQDGGLSTADVYRAADAIGSTRASSTRRPARAGAPVPRAGRRARERPRARGAPLRPDLSDTSTRSAQPARSPPGSPAPARRRSASSRTGQPRSRPPPLYRRRPS